MEFLDSEIMKRFMHSAPVNIFFKDTECKYRFVSEICDMVSAGENGSIVGKTDLEIQKFSEMGRMYYEDDTIQHAGVVIGFGGIAGHCFVQQPRGNTGYCHRIICAQDYSAVTAACMMVKRSVFDEVGGLTEELAVAFNDIDFCMKVRQKGYLVVYNPYAELYHYESKSRGLEDTPEKLERFHKEIRTFETRWPEIMKNGDPYYNPNLSLETQDFSLKRL